MLPITNSSTEFSSPSFHFPWPFLDEGLFMFSHNNAPANQVNGATLIPKKRKHVPSKKDRHSKIRTAQGLRDRRIRLSLKVARKFFDLQDMLGFDKASKTIEWLFINSKEATQLLTHSQVEPEAKEMGQELLVGDKRKRRESCKVATMFNNHLATKSARDKARARARERTKEKLLIRGLEAAGHEDSGNFYTHEINSSPKAHLLEEPQGSVAVIEELLGITRSSSSSSNFSYNSPASNAMWSPSLNSQNPCPNSVLSATNSTISFPTNQLL